MSKIAKPYLEYQERIKKFAIAAGVKFFEKEDGFLVKEDIKISDFITLTKKGKIKPRTKVKQRLLGIASRDLVKGEYAVEGIDFYSQIACDLSVNLDKCK